MFFCCFACRPEEVEPIEEKPYHFVEFIRHAGECDGDSTNCAVFKAFYPQYDSADAGIRTRINNSILEAVIKSISDGQGGGTSLQDLAQDFFKDYNEYSSGPFSMPWEMECNGTVLFLSDRIFSLQISNYKFTGGAHPNTITSMLNYDLEKGSTIQLSDLVIDWQNFNHIAEKYFRRSKDMDAQLPLENSGYFWGEDFKLSNNFAITEAGILLYYNTYEIAPYVGGITSFVIPFEELEKIIHPEFIPNAT